MINTLRRLFLLSAVSVCALGVTNAWSAAFERQWVYASETSAAIYWQLGDISAAALSQVEFGTTEQLGQSTEMTRKPRWSHLHRLAALLTDTTYYYRMVVVDTLTGGRAESGILSFRTTFRPDAIRLPGDLSGPPYELDQPGAYYILTEDVSAPMDAFHLAAEDVTLDLDGHTVTFGDNTDKQVFGVRFTYRGKGTLCNGHIAQGARSGDYSCAIRSNGRPNPTEIFGITTDVHLKAAYPVNFFSQASDVQIHHNHFYSRVTELVSRHYPGNAILQMYISGGNIHIYDNLITEGCHRGIYLVNPGFNVEVDHNDIRHHQQYVNGYALKPNANSNFHHNRVTSTGRGAHLSRENIQFHDNYFDLSGHMTLSDLPANTRPFKHRMIELHGIKLEGNRVRNCKVYDNYVRITQKLPNDSGGTGPPEDKIENGVYIRSVPTGSSGSGLIDDTRNWEEGRWQFYFLRYSDDFPPAYIGQNDRTTLIARLDGPVGQDYSVYMKWQYVPPTPLNIASYDVAANNEVYGNTFIAITKYEDKDIWHGGYGETGNWATAIMFVSMDKGPAPQGLYSTYVHDNTFISNDLFLNSYTDVNMTVRVENNTFNLEGAPHIIERASRFRAIGTALEASVLAGGNQFNLSAEKKTDINGDGAINVADALSFLVRLRRQPDNPLADWNVDGRIDLMDIFTLLKDIVASRGTSINTPSLAGQIAGDSLSTINATQFSRLLSSGRNGL